MIWLEAEQFETVGGWSNDSQFVDLMGSPYLLATGLGKPVDDAVTTVRIAKGRRYRLWLRCKDWLAGPVGNSTNGPEPSKRRISNGAGHSPGQFRVQVGRVRSPVTFGKADSDAWQCVDGGTFELEADDVEI